MDKVSKPLVTVELVASLVSLTKAVSLALIAVLIEWGERRRRYAEAEQSKAEMELTVERKRQDVKNSIGRNSRDIISNFLRK